MKRIFTFLVMLLAAIAVNAQNLKVKGVIVSDANMNDILGDGKVKFDKSTNTLTFTDADITYTEHIVSASSTWKENLNIKFEGKNTFTTTGNNSCIYLACKQQEVKLWSDEYTMGSLTINVTDEKDGDQGIENMGHNNITLLRLDLTINVPKSDGIGPLNSSATVEKLTIDKCNVAIKAGRAALRFKEVELIDSHYQEGYAINGEKNSGCTYDGTVMKEVKVDEDIYAIWVDDKQVTAKIKHNILIDEAPAYTMYFEPKTNELTLNNAKIEATNDIAIGVYNYNLSSGNEFKLNLIGKNEIISSPTSTEAVRFCPKDVESVLIYSTSAGSLDITGSNSSGMLTAWAPRTFTIKDCTLNIKNAHESAPAISGDEDEETVFNFINANISAESAGPDVFKWVYGLYYQGCFMNTPTDGFLTGNHTLASKGSTSKFVVVPGVDNIKPNFYYGDTPSVESLTHNSVKLVFNSAMDNLSYQNKIKYSVKVAKAEEPENWVKDYDLYDIDYSSTQLQTEISGLEPETKYIVRLKAIDEAGNYDYYKDVEFTTLEEPSAINTVLTGKSDTKMYNVTGVQVDNSYRGIVIKNGKKVKR